MTSWSDSAEAALATRAPKLTVASSVANLRLFFIFPTFELLKLKILLPNLHCARWNLAAAKALTFVKKSPEYSKTMDLTAGL
ncbi:hypothetical protein MCP1_60048 [Candidatus Terasakiella magnetica]|nr:hypothetical protein MCP1_60048 [Candidatus Terasakiella magnetica]